MRRKVGSCSLGVSRQNMQSQAVRVICFGLFPAVVTTDTIFGNTAFCSRFAHFSFYLKTHRGLILSDNYRLSLSSFGRSVEPAEEMRNPCLREVATPGIANGLTPGVSNTSGRR
jgi:hypothetical protein